ncbi:MAG: hypothetical protein HKN23_17365 [Verrucomicrobiales bacterium]|nr:hypothetical protein [Verrucomicrobiales bacterium]
MTTIHQVGERILSAAERKFGKLAIPGLLRWIATFQLAVWALSFMPNSQIISSLDMNAGAILSGQVWRIFTWMFVPFSMHFIWIIFGVLIFWLISDSLESAWGVFRANVFAAATLFLVSVTGFLLSFASGGLGSIMSVFLYMLMFIAFATLFPNYEFRLFFLIPVKVKWLALIDVAMIVAMVVMAPIAIFVVIPGFIPYFLVFVPTFFQNIKNRGEAAVRRERFKSQTRTGESDAFHVCHACGKTDLSDPNQDFRVSSRDGEEYCLDCLPKLRATD